MHIKTQLSTKNISRKAKMAFILLLITAYITGCSSSPSPTAEPKPAAETLVKVESISKQSMGDPREQVAEVSASVRVDITAEAGGIVLSMLKKNGQRVKAGDVIAKLDNKNSLIEKEKARAAYTSAEQSLAASTAESATNRLQLTNNIAKLEDLLKQQAREGNEADNKETVRSLQVYKQQLAALEGNKALAALQAQVETSKLILEQAERSWGNGEIKAPVSGVLTDVKADEGMNVSAGSAFGIVQNTGKVKIKAQLTQTAADLARNKREIVFYGSDNDSLKRKAKVISLAEIPDASTKLYALELEADNADGSLIPASRVQLQLTTPEEENVVAVPSLSILREGQETYVFVLNGSKAEKRKVSLGRINGIYQEVLQGVSVGDQLVVSGQHALKEGQTVRK
ncbi:efflux RND transporter periplasmic adaptor subunit [Cohnella silvisoli]|uniref:Efflux RND transporter periplasmic adaptor subunit n=1 Tax=Cohnella silvisoli TaxID=2873699 RepID=A0ABV1KY81_9BACL|nr:efflux RND transporter periplasmic adaptor subunit [Cohnella silvisoli]MCD9021805.1 efflux RND transporter periplasmic adaptor subunit [Cohnella silvisoli]